MVTVYVDLCEVCDYYKGRKSVNVLRCYYEDTLHELITTTSEDGRLKLTCPGNGVHRTPSP